MTKCKIFLTIIVLECFTLTAIYIHGKIQSSTAQFRLLHNREIAQQLTLTDLAIWTEARYTRHPSQTDFFTPFQDFPGAPDHFPAGSIISPASHSGKHGGGVQ